MKILAVLLGTISLAFAYTDPQCSGYDHEIYGCVGECVSTSDCPGSKYQSNLCPTQANGIKCCFTADSDADCANYDHSMYGQVGSCIESSQCPSSNYISNLCPTKKASIKCCFSKPTGTCSSGGGACPRIISRSEWGARSPTSTTLLSTPTRYAVVHHTDGSSCSTESSCKSQVRGIQNYHMDSNGWDDIGYNFLIGGDGNVYEGRGWNYKGAHASTYNSCSIGISMIGSFTDSAPSSLMMNVLYDLLDCAQSRDSLIPDYILFGHRQAVSTECPGDALYSLLQQHSHYEYISGSVGNPTCTG